MIRFRDTKNRSTPPPWLAGAPSLHQRPSAHGTLWACGDAYMLADAGPWAPLDDGYEVAGPADDPTPYLRPVPWLDTVTVSDYQGRWWTAPRILDAAGDRVFRVSYGPDWLPALTAQQYRYVEIAKAARDGLTAGNAGVQDVPMQTACRWAAELLCATYHLTPEAIGHLRILDDALVAGVISASIGASVEAT